MRVAEPDQARALRIASHPALELTLRISLAARLDGRMGGPPFFSDPSSGRRDAGKFSWQIGARPALTIGARISRVAAPDPRAKVHAARPDAALDPARSFQGLILTLQTFWAGQGCVMLQPYDMEVGAGTFHPATTLRSLGPSPGRRLMCSRRAGPRTAATARTPTGCSTITSSR